MGILLKIAFILVIIGALNWGLVGFFKYDLIGAVFGERSAVSRVIYALVGIAGIVMLILIRHIRIA